MSDLFEILAGLLRQEFEKEEMRQKVLQPLMQWFFRHIIPYVVAIILLNFFLTIGAVSLVLYFRG